MSHSLPHMLHLNNVKVSIYPLLLHPVITKQILPNTKTSCFCRHFNCQAFFTISRSCWIFTSQKSNSSLLNRWLDLHFFFLPFSFSFTMFKNAHVNQYNSIKSVLKYFNIISSMKTRRNAWNKTMTATRLNNNKNVLVENITTLQAIYISVFKAQREALKRNHSSAR